MESDVDRALALLLATGEPFDYPMVRELVAPPSPEVPRLDSLSAPDLKVYDALLVGGV